VAEQVRYATDEELRVLIEEFRERVLEMRPDISSSELEDLVKAALQDALPQ
jgi:hypothetical protein